MAAAVFWQRVAIGYLLLLLSISLVRAESPNTATYQREVLVEYLYLDANEDQASGGHAAMRINDDVFHFHANEEKNDFSEKFFKTHYQGPIKRGRLGLTLKIHYFLRLLMAQMKAM